MSPIQIQLYRSMTSSPQVGYHPKPFQLRIRLVYSNRSYLLRTGNVGSLKAGMHPRGPPAVQRFELVRYCRRIDGAARAERQRQDEDTNNSLWLVMTRCTPGLFGWKEHSIAG